MNTLEIRRANWRLGIWLTRRLAGTAVEVFVEWLKRVCNHEGQVQWRRVYGVLLNAFRTIFPIAQGILRLLGIEASLPVVAERQ